MRKHKEKHVAAGFFLTLPLVLLSFFIYRDGRAGEPNQASLETVLIKFELNRADSSTSAPKNDGQQVEAWVEHRSGKILRVYSRISVGNKITQEKKWNFNNPDRIEFREWSKCLEDESALGNYEFNKLEELLRETFGPREIPNSAIRGEGGRISWEEISGFEKRRIFDKGGSYPDREIETLGPNNSVLVKTMKTSIDSVKFFPEWSDDWINCRITTY